MAATISPTASDVLLVIDVQPDFCAGGALAVPDGDAVVPVINRLAGRFAHAVATQDWHPPDHLSFASQHDGAAPFQTVELDYGAQVLWPDHCVQRSAGAALHDGLSLPHCELIVRKGFRRHIDSYSAFFENDRETPTGLNGYLRERGLTRLFAVGLATDFCVRYSAVDGCRLGFDVVLVADACRAIDTDGSLDAAMREMGEAGVAIAESSAIG